MSTTDPIATVNAYFDAFGARDLDRLLSFFAPDASWLVPGDRARAARVRGAEHDRRW